MVTVIFDPNGGPLIAKAVFLGDLIADYEIALKEQNSSTQTTLLEGDNLNPQDDSAFLPTPVKINHGRRVKLNTVFAGLHPDVNTEYQIRLEIFQDDVFLGADIDESDENNKLTGKAQPSLLLVNLLAKQ